jgi:hypothetical protein
MKISFDLPEMYVTIISKWASVCRTLRTAQSACEDAAEALRIDNETKFEMYSWCSQELEALIPALDNLHHTARSAIWAKNQVKGIRYRLKVKQVVVQKERMMRLHSDISIEEMAGDIAEFGQEVPICIRREDDKFVLIDGLLRLQAIKKLDWLEIDAIQT